jgi:hypothetical protein
LTRTRGRGDGGTVAGLTATSSSFADPPPVVAGASVAFSLWALLITVVSMGSRHMSLGIGDLDVLVDDRIELRVVYQAGNAVEMVRVFRFNHAATGQSKDSFFRGAAW